MMGRNAKGGGGASRARRAESFRLSTADAIAQVRGSNESARRLFDSSARSLGERRAGTVARLASGFMRGGTNPVVALTNALTLTDRAGMRGHRMAWQGAGQLGRNVRRNLANEIVLARRNRRGQVS